MKLLGALLGMAVVGAPLFVIITVLTALAWWVYKDVHTVHGIAIIVKPLAQLIERNEFLAIPLFIGAGAIMTEGGLARRLVAVANAALGWLPGGLAVSAVIACMFFAAISGSSPVTLIAVGSIMFPAMVKNHYPENFSLGLVMTAGSLGCLIPPAVAMLIYAISVQGQGAVDPSELFIAGLGPALFISGALVIYSMWVGRKVPRPAEEQLDFRQRMRVLGDALREGIWALFLPVIVLGGIYGGLYVPSEAGAVAVVYALVVTVFIHRELSWVDVIRVLANAGKLMGLLILIIGLAFSLNEFLAAIQIDRKLEELVDAWQLGPVAFLLLVNVVLIVLGALMDSISATLIFAPMLAPIAVRQYGMDPLHFGVVFVVNMEIGYLAPPVATNLFVAAAVFKKPFTQVMRAVLPTLAMTCAALVVFMYVPTCSMGLVNLNRGDPVWEPFPWDGEPVHVRNAKAGSAAELGDLSEKAMEETGFGEDGGTGQSEDEMYEELENIYAAPPGGDEGGEEGAGEENGAAAADQDGGELDLGNEFLDQFNDDAGAD